MIGVSVAKRILMPAFGLCLVFPLIVLGTVVPLSSAAQAGSGPASSARVFAWGDNSTGQLGDGTVGGTSDVPAAVVLPSGVTPIAIAAGGGGGGGDMESSQSAAYALGSDGNVYAWGDNSNGALGNGSAVASSGTPVVVSLPSGVTALGIGAAQGTGYAIGSDGRLYAWGDNNLGKLGDGSAATNSFTPVVVSLPTGVTPTAVAGGYQSAYALGSDGKVYAWGDNFYGELGNGSTTNSTTPVPISLPTEVTATAIAGGGGTGFAIGSDGRLYSWGYNVNGGLGDNSTSNSDDPVVVELPSGVTPKAITAGGGFAHAIGSDGNLYGWGLDSTADQLGDGRATDSDTPVVVTLAPGVTPTAIADNIHTGYAIGSDGKVYAWGYGLAGELGDGADGNFSPPVVVSSPSGSTADSLGAEPGAVAGYVIVSQPNPDVSITTTSLPPATVGQPYSFQLQAAGGFPPYAWNKYGPVGSGVLAHGLSLSRSGLVSGVPRRAGSYTFTVKCLDSTHSHKAQAVATFTLVISP
jgi:alpha-tubulin suppressor-like RCC1 family protein